jgi:2-hydroxychromene-2-carboxylate isomerase
MAGSSTARSADQPVFYYDLGSPQCYIVAETIMAALPVVAEWEPVLGSDIAPADPDQSDREQLEHRISQAGLQPVRWPPNWPPDTTKAMLAAMYAKRIGRAVAFSLAAFRQAFAGGRDLSDENTVLIAGAACEMHPTALRRGIELAATQAALQTATARARGAGVTALPAIQVGDAVFTGTEATKAAADLLQT